MPEPGSPQRRRLDRDRVLAEALALADADGLDAVSMRALAARLEVVPMALYKHVADKEDLIGGMVDAVIAGYARPAATGTWRERVRERALIARAAHLAHPWLREAIQSRRRRSAAVLGHMDAVAGEFIAGGFSVDLTHHVMHALGNRVWGFSPEAFDGGDDVGQPDGDPAALLRMMSERFPHVTAIALDASARNPSGSCDEQFEFEFTLDLLLDAFERLRAAGWESSG
ncbi:TetR/AcrR family transcriptional regulator C-terminal domain-containing protein [Leucobacter weissii]|uniref:TetR/AcrR family transcriptional regulator C-terminal domain-containing protein n=1 Tax=Leucobacter weissii TaxID=1983706 RepID=A0A939MNP3_9MICO|nr:TetR/AcrR family transcriptional regulator [Leucobacter weissii]MBO1901791.1 TetR/AcrR family transcriptional regulator C-terminal domain-containing protein [Leucobacter weissii]